MKTIELVKKYRHIFGTDYTQDADCLAAWMMDEGSGETLGDTSSSSFDGTFKGAGEPAWETSDVPPNSPYNSLDFDGDDDYITLPDSGGIGTSADKFSICNWMNITDTSGAQDMIVNQTNDRCWWKINNGSSDKLNLYLGNTNTPGYHNSDSGITYGSWTHVGFSYDGTTITFYQDGVADGTSGDTGSPDWLATNTVKIGIRPDLSGTHYLTKFLADMGIFDTNLDSTEMNDIMDNGLDGTWAAAAVTRRRQYMTTNKGYW